MKQVIYNVETGETTFEEVEEVTLEVEFHEQLTPDQVRIKRIEAQQQQSNEDLAAFMDFIIGGV